MAITKILNIQTADDRNPATHLQNAIEYIQNPDKTEECVLVGSINCLPDTAFEQMLETKKLYHKTGKRQGYHVIISFSPDEVVTAEQALYVVEHFAKDVLGDDYEAVYTVHTDKEHMHAHLIWNSVSLVTGKKYNSPKGNWKNKLQPITNKYCNELGLAICPAEYSKHPVNMTRDEWQKEQEFKEFIFRDAQFCALTAGSVEHFEFLMRKLGYEFQPGKYMRVRIPGRKIYHRLDKMHEMFEEGKLQYWVDKPWSAKPYFYSNNPEKIYHAGMSDYQKRFYAKMYRMRVIEHKRFDYKSAYYAEELRKLYKLQDEYLLLVKNDIRNISGLIRFIEDKENEIKSIDARQHEIYKENQRRKRKIVTTEDMREYQSWHLSVEGELAKLKEKKKKAKSDYQLAGKVLRENTYTALSVGLENEEVMDAEKVVMPEYVSIRDVVTNLNNTIEEDVISETAVSKEEKLEEAVCENTMLVEGDEVSEVIEEKLPTDKKEYECATEQYQDYVWSNEEIMSGEASEVEVPDDSQEKVSNEVAEVSLVATSVQNTTQTDIKGEFPGRYAEYMALLLKERVELHGLLDEELDATVFDIVRRNFDKAGYRVAFDDLSDEVTAIKKYISEQKCISNAEMIAGKLQEYGSYESIPSSVKAEVFGFKIDDSNGNLKLYMQVMKALGARMSQEEMFEDYQKVYEETIKRQGEDEIQKNRMRERGRAR